MLPCLRQRERVFVGPQFDIVARNMFAGSILDLEPDTDYEARFVMTDPDGVTGEATRIVTVRTRAEPIPARTGGCFTSTRMASRAPSSNRPSRG